MKLDELTIRFLTGDDKKIDRLGKIRDGKESRQRESANHRGCRAQEYHQEDHREVRAEHRGQGDVAGSCQEGLGPDAYARTPATPGGYCES